MLSHKDINMLSQRVTLIIVIFKFNTRALILPGMYIRYSFFLLFVCVFFMHFDSMCSNERSLDTCVRLVLDEMYSMFFNKD